jgi:hypothetical protein
MRISLLCGPGKIGLEVPGDATVYECVKGLVGCLPAVREGGVVATFRSRASMRAA